MTRHRPPQDSAHPAPPRRRLLARRSHRLIFAIALLAIGSLVSAGLSFLHPAKADAFEVGVWYNIESRHSGLVLGIRAASTANGAELVQWDSNGSQDQQFRFLDSGGGYYRIQARHSNKVVDVADFSTADGATVHQWTDADSTNQQWQIQESGGYATFVNRLSGKALDVWEWSTTRGTRISQYAPTGATNQQWKLTKVGGGSLPPGVDALEGFAQGTTGGAAGQTVTVTNQADLNRYVTAAEPYVIRVQGAITISPKGTELKVASNKSIVGVGTSGEIGGGGFFLGDSTSNVIIRNLTIRDTRMPEDDPDDKDFDYDGIQMDGADHVWIDHNKIVRMNDGLIDSRKDTTNLTVSWNNIGEGNKSFGIGWTDNVTAQITIHHNWIHDTNSRNPSTDNVKNAHLYNNYMQNITGYGNYSRGGTSMVIENTYFQNVKDPYYPDSTAQLRQTGSICNGCTGRQTTLGSAFNPSSFYSYTLHPASQVPALVGQYAGPQSWIGV